MSDGLELHYPIIFLKSSCDLAFGAKNVAQMKSVFLYLKASSNWYPALYGDNSNSWRLFGLLSMYNHIDVLLLTAVKENRQPSYQTLQMDESFLYSLRIEVLEWHIATNCSFILCSNESKEKYIYTFGAVTSNVWGRWNEFHLSETMNLCIHFSIKMWYLSRGILPYDVLEVLHFSHTRWKAINGKLSDSILRLLFWS